MSIPIDQFDPIRKAAQASLMDQLRSLLQEANVKTGKIPKSLESMLKALDQKAFRIRDQDLLARIEHAQAQLRTFSVKPTTSKFFKTTKEVKGTDRIHLAMEADDFEPQMLSLEEEVYKYGDDVGINLRNAFGDTIPLGEIKDYDKYRYFKKRYEDLIGLQEVLETEGSGIPVISTEEAAKRGGRLRPYHRFAFDDDTPRESLRRAFFSRINLQISPEIVDRPDRMMHEAYGISGNVPKLSTLRKERDLLMEGIPAGRQAILDIETAGLEHSSGMWQMAVRYSDTDEVDQLFFRNPHLDRGSAFIEGKVVPLSEKLMPSGTHYSSVEDLKGVLQKIINSDMIVGHNAASFDLPFIMSDLERLAKELTPDGVPDVDLLALRDQLGDKIKRGKVLDTMSIMNEEVDRLGLKLSPLLETLPNGDMGKLKSLQNFLLQTNVLDLLAQKHGEDEIYKMVVGQGTHDASVDTLFTGALSDPEIRENLQALNGKRQIGGLRKRKGGAAKIREIEDAIVGSQATTAFTNMAPGEIHQPIKELIERAGYDPKTNPITYFEHNVLQQKMLGDALPAADLTETNPVRYFHRAGDFKKFVEGQTGDGVIQDIARLADAEAALIPRVEDYHEFQKGLSQLNLPHANLSYPERALSASLSRVSTPIGKPGLTSHLDGILPTSIWYDEDEIKVMRSGRVAIPKRILEEAEAAKVFTHGDVQRTAIASGEELYALSPFRYGDKTNVSKNFRFAEDPAKAKVEASELFEFIKRNQARFKVNTKTLDALAPQLTAPEAFDALSPSGVYKYGVQTGLIRSMKSPDEEGFASRAFDAVVRFMGGDPEKTARPADLTGPTAYVGDFGKAETVAGRNVQRSGPAVLGRWMGQPARTRYLEQSNQAGTIMAAMAEENPKWLEEGAARKIASKSIAGERILDLSEDLLKNHSRKLGIGLAATAAVGGYYLYKRHQRKQDYYTETTGAMPNEPKDWYEDYQKEIGPSAAPSFGGGGGYARQSLSTANVVSNLDNRKIGHTQMGSGKYSHLFGG